MLKKYCPRCRKFSYSACAEGPWKCPSCRYDLTNLVAKPLDKFDGEGETVYLVININTGQVLVSELRKADTFLTRFMGLLPYKQIKRDQGLLLTPCNGVHTMFMRFTIDVLYLDESLRVTKTYSEVKPWRVLPISKHGKHVLEVAPGTIESTNTREGHILQIQ